MHGAVGDFLAGVVEGLTEALPDEVDVELRLVPDRPDCRRVTMRLGHVQFGLVVERTLADDGHGPYLRRFGRGCGRRLLSQWARVAAKSLEC